jgi:hypothetical protein
MPDDHKAPGLGREKSEKTLTSAAARKLAMRCRSRGRQRRDRRPERKKAAPADRFNRLPQTGNAGALFISIVEPLACRTAPLIFSERLFHGNKTFSATGYNRCSPRPSSEGLSQRICFRHQAEPE